MVFVGVDWAEAHHDLCVLDEAGQMLGKRRVSDGLQGVRLIHELLASYVEQREQVVVGIETDRGLLVGALVAAGYQVYAINPLSVSRYRERHVTSRAKSDPGDAKVLADLVRTDRHNHRQVAGDSELAEAVKVLARAHQDLVWSRQRFANRLRNTLREFYPAALQAFNDLDSGDALAVLERAPTPVEGRRLSQAKIVSALRRGGRERNLDARAVEIQSALRSEQLQAPARVSSAYGVVVKSTVQVLAQMNQELAQLEAELSQSFEEQPDAEIYRSLPGLGLVLSARALAEFGDDPNRFNHAKSRKAYAGSAPSPRPPAPDWSCWPGSPATDIWPMPATSGPSPASPAQLELAATTTASVAAARHTIRPSAHWPTAGSASCTAASGTGRPTRNQSRGRPRSELQLDFFQPWDV